MNKHIEPSSKCFCGFGHTNSTQCFTNSQALAKFTNKLESNNILQNKMDETSDNSNCQHSCNCSIDLNNKKNETTVLNTTDTKTSKLIAYRIEKMDCPIEEDLIRKKLLTIKGIENLDFNLMNMTLKVYHQLKDPSIITKALNDIDMEPEVIDLEKTSVVFFALDKAVEQQILEKKLKDISNLINYQLIGKELKCSLHHSALPLVSNALMELGLKPKLLKSASEEQSKSSSIPWKKLSLAAILAAFSELFELIVKWQINFFGLNLNYKIAYGLTVGNCLTAFLAVSAIYLAGFVTYKKGWLSISNFDLNINALMSVAVTGGICIGQFPEAAMVMVLFNISEAMESKSLDKARHAIKSLLDITPETATLKSPDGSWIELDVRQIAINSLVRVRPGERIPLDGIISDGFSTVNQAPITGESLPVEKKVGDQVYAGSINESGSFEFKVSAEASNSTLAKVIKAVKEAQSNRAPIQSFIDKFAKIYTPAIFAIAILTALIPPILMEQGWVESIYTALVLLVIGCPCALVISTPVTIVSGMASAASQGILIKGGIFIELGRKIKCLALDKTGTITSGKPKQTDFINLGKLSDDEVKNLAINLALRSDHPVSKAIADIKINYSNLEIKNFQAILGQGIQGNINGQTWYLGNSKLIKALGKSHTKLEKSIIDLEKQGKSVVALIGLENVEAIFAVADTIKASSVDAIKELKLMGIKTIMLTGDNEHTAKTVADKIGVDTFKGNLLPEDKMQIVADLAKDSKIGMVGDGINDAPALAKADIGFAMASGGTDTAIETADVALMDDDLKKIPKFIKLSQSTYNILLQNITLALSVKGIFFALTLAGKATMWMAVFADVGTALIVVANGLRALKK